MTDRMALWARAQASFLTAVMALGGCSSKRPPAPDKTKMAAMTFEERCAATEARAIPCASQLVTASLASSTSISYEEAGELSPDEHLTGIDAKKIHRTLCAGTDGYPGAVVACWEEPTCRAFATCVMTSSGPTKAPRP